MSDKIKESSLLKSESELIKNANVRENTNTRIGSMFWRIVEYTRTLVNNVYIELENKVTKDGTKQLSDENFTTSYKQKLDNLVAYEKPSSEPISYIQGLQQTLDDKINKSNISQNITNTNADVNVVSVALLDKIRKEIIDAVFANVEVNRDNYSIVFRNQNNDNKASVDLSFLVSNAFTLTYNELTKSIELVNKNGEKSSIPVRNLLSNIPTKLQLNNEFDIQLKTENEAISTISLATLFSNKTLWDNAGEHQKITDGSNPHNTTFDNILNKPTTAAGYGITDVVLREGTKQLSDENFTTNYKQKLEGLQNYQKPTSEPIQYIVGLEPRLTDIESEITTLKQHNQNTTEISIVKKKFAH